MVRIKCAQLPCLLGIEPCCRLIQKQYLRLGRQRPGYLQQPLAADGNACRRLVCNVLKADHFQIEACPLAGNRLLPAHPRQPQRRADNAGARPDMAADHHILKHRHVAENLGGLKCPGKPAAGYLMRLQPGNGFLVEKNSSPVRRMHAAHHIQKRGFPRPVGADNRCYGIARNEKGEVVQRHDPAKSLAYI